MRFSDPYTDETGAAEVAAALKLQSEGGKSPVDRLRETPRLDLVKTALRPEPGGARHAAASVFLYDLESAAQDRHGRPGADEEARRDQAEAGGLAAGRRAPGRAGGAPGPAGGRRSCW